MTPAMWCLDPESQPRLVSWPPALAASAEGRPMLGLLPLAGGYRGKRSRREADWIRQEAGPERQQKGLRTRVGWELVTECGWEDASRYGRWRSAATCPDHQGGLRLTVFVSPHNGPLHVMSPTRTQASEARKEQAGGLGLTPREPGASRSLGAGSRTVPGLARQGSPPEPAWAPWRASPCPRGRSSSADISEQTARSRDLLVQVMFSSVLQSRNILSGWS